MSTNYETDGHTPNRDTVTSRARDHTNKSVPDGRCLMLEGAMARGELSEIDGCVENRAE